MGAKESDPRQTNGGILQEPTLPIAGNISPDIESLTPFELARQDVMAAHELYRNNNYGSSTEAKLHDAFAVAKAYVGIRMDASSVLSEIDGGIETIESDRREIMLAEKAQVLATSGAIEEAFSVADQISKKGHSGFTAYHTYKRIAAVTDDNAIARKAFDKAKEAAGRYPMQQDGHLLCMLAEAEYEKGFDPARTLQEAKRVLVTHEGKKSYWYGPLVKAYATAGRFREALKLVPRVAESNPSADSKHQPHKLSVLRDIAFKQAAAGVIEGAIETAKLTQDPYSQTAITAETAKEAARQAHPDADSMMCTAIELVKHFERNVNFTRPHELLDAHGSDLIAYLYTDLAEATAYSGGDPEPFFGKATEFAMQGSEHDCSKAATTLAHIAKSQAKFGFDPRQIFDQALALADKIFESPNTDLHEWASQMIAYEDIGHAAIDAGYFKMVEQIFERLDKDTDSDSTTDKIKLLGHRAKARLSVQELPNAA